MNRFIADLHTHTLLSPCGDREMMPELIIETALRKGIDIIGITDHNSTKHCRLTEHYAKNRNIFVLCGAEVTTMEEAHCLVFFPTHEHLNQFQNFLEENLPYIPNSPDFSEDQVQIDEDMNIVYQEPRLLTNGLKVSTKKIEQEVHRLDGIFIPAHIDRRRYSVISQLGIIPFDLQYEAVQISILGNKEEILKQHSYLKNKTFIRSSDAHSLAEIGMATSVFEMGTCTFEEIRKALLGMDGRKVQE